MALVDWIVAQLREHPELAFFLTVAIGYVLGRIRLGSFALGSVTGVLLAGVVVGQLGIEIAPIVKQCFFLLFLFAIGYGTGPQFFRGLKSDGAYQALLTVMVCCIGLLVGWLTSLLLGYGSRLSASSRPRSTATSLTSSASLIASNSPRSALARIVSVLAWASEIGPTLT